MRFKIEPNSIEFEDLKSKLEAQFPDYTFKVRQKNYLVCAKSSTIGTNILLRKTRLIVVGNFPSMLGSLIFVAAILLLGVLIPLVLYFVVFHTKMKKLEKEIADFLAQEYQIK